MERTLLGATTPGKSEPGSDSNEGVLRILLISSITETSPSAHLMSYPGHSLRDVLHFRRGAVGVFYSLSRLGHRKLVGGSHPSAEKQSMYSTVPADLAISVPNLPAR